MTVNPNTQVCTRCGTRPANGWVRDQVARQFRLRYRERRQNRRRLDPGYWRIDGIGARLRAAGWGAEWGGQQVCPRCMREFNVVLNTH